MKQLRAETSVNPVNDFCWRSAVPRRSLEGCVVLVHSAGEASCADRCPCRVPVSLLVLHSAQTVGPDLDT